MKAYVTPPPGLSRAMTRVSRALDAYAPSAIEITPKQSLADIVVLHIIGWTGVEAVIAELERAQQAYAVIQYCIRSTERPQLEPWIDVWRRALVTWSYYNIPQLAMEGEHGAIMYDRVAALGSSIYCAPLGVDPLVFRPRHAVAELTGRPYLLCTTGYVAESECIRECAEAVARCGGRMIHIGPDLRLGDHVTCKIDISDEELANIYSQSKFVVGLRRGEGFELPAAEGLMCGARPIVFDRLHYRMWFQGLAEFIPENDPEQVVISLCDVLLRPWRPVTPAERYVAQSRFDWPSVVTPFWQHVLARMTVRI